MTLKQFQLFFTESLSGLYPKSEIESFLSLVLEEQLDLQRIDIVLKPDLLINNKDVSLLKKTVHRLQNEEPIQYILGKTEFLGLPFYVNQATLIPRPETEELVAWIIAEVTEWQSERVSIETNLKILDIGTGSGCIAISLQKKLPNATVFAVDLSKEALKMAKKNADLNKVVVNFLELDILKAEQLPEQFDIIVSNPPYVRALEKVDMHNNVLSNEPHLALFVSDDNPLIFYKKIAELAKKYLKNNGQLFFEINQYLGEETKNMLLGSGYSSVELRKDLFKNDRMIRAQF